MYDMNIQNDVIGLVLCENCKSKQVTEQMSRHEDGRQVMAKTHIAFGKVSKKWTMPY
jgi:hypothetical protein